MNWLLGWRFNFSPGRELSACELPGVSSAAAGERCEAVRGGARGSERAGNAVPAPPVCVGLRSWPPPRSRSTCCGHSVVVGPAEPGGSQAGAGTTPEEDPPGLTHRARPGAGGWLRRACDSPKPRDRPRAPPRPEPQLSDAESRPLSATSVDFHFKFSFVTSAFLGKAGFSELSFLPELPGDREQGLPRGPSSSSWRWCPRLPTGALMALPCLNSPQAAVNIL